MMIACFLVVGLAILTVTLASALAELRRQHQALQEQYQELMHSRSFNRTIPSRRDVSQREYYDRLDELGFSSMLEYRRSELWLRTKERYRRSDYPQRCLVCESRDFD